MNKVLAGLEAVVCQMDDTLVFKKSQEEHDLNIIGHTNRILAAGLTLNKEKCTYSSTRLTFLGHIIDKDHISADQTRQQPYRIGRAPLNDVTGLRQFMRMVTQRGTAQPALGARCLATSMHCAGALLSKRPFLT